MENLFTKLFICFFVLISTELSAKTLELKKNLGSIFLEENPDWTLSKDLYGIPFMFFSKQENSQRSNISFTNTGADLELDFKELSSSQDEFKKEKKAWAKKIGAEIISFIPYTLSKNENLHKVHEIGMRYLFKDKRYVEKSYYIECKGRLLYSKSLRLEQNEDHAKDFSTFIKTLDC